MTGYRTNRTLYYRLNGKRRPFSSTPFEIYEVGKEYRAASFDPTSSEADPCLAGLHFFSDLVIAKDTALVWGCDVIEIETTGPVVEHPSGDHRTASFRVIREVLSKEQV